MKNLEILGKVENDNNIFNYIKDNYQEEILESVLYTKEDDVFSNDLENNDFSLYSDNINNDSLSEFVSTVNEFEAHISNTKIFITDVDNNILYFYKKLF